MAPRKSTKKTSRKSSKKTTGAVQKSRKKVAKVTEAPQIVTAKRPVESPPRLTQRTSRAEATRILPENFHALYDRGFRAARGIVAAALPQETAGLRRLSADVPDVVVEYDQATQLPNRVVSQQPTSRLSRGRVDSPEQAVTEFVQNRGDLWNLTPEDVSTVEVVSVSRKGLQTVNLIQRVEGKEIFNSDVTAAVSPDNEVISLAGQLFPGTASTSARTRAAAVTITSAEEAIAKAASDLTGDAYEAADFSQAEAPPDSDPYRFYQFTAKGGDPRPRFERPVRLKDVMFPLGEGQFVPGYYLELWFKGFPAFSYVIDAIETPDVLFRRNLTSHIAFKYLVHNTGDAVFRPEDGPAPGTPHPTGVPDGFQAKPIKEKLIQIESLLPGNPWLASNAKTTSGNNCIAYADLTGPDGFSVGDVLGKVTSPRSFNHKYDHAKPASDPKNLQNSLVGMFFHVNWLHDRWYEAGFDEASRNAQKDNFGRGGLGGDHILAEGHDFSGFDNANMATPADGSSPRMQMFEFKGPGPSVPSRTSNHEALITFHEMGHYITNRLVGNGNGLTNQQGEAMGEGWGDFFAICMTSQSTDNFAKGVFAAGGWTDMTPSFKENYYFSIRRYPYSADMTKSPLTFKHISSNVMLPSGPPRNPNSGGPNNEVHNAGEIWCAALWEVFVNLVAKHQHAKAEELMLAYVIGGLKNTPLRPTFTQARDAIITAVSSLDPGDLPQVRAGFAKRGMGAGAVSPPASSTSLSGVIESFTP
jgi:extracellular elastinolytic metalloproteinase